jgi:hypothetical protein
MYDREMSQPDPRRQALDAERPEVRPYLERFFDHQEKLSEAMRKRDGISWRLDQIPERAKSREGEERQKLLDRAEVLSEELRSAIVAFETLRLQAIPIEIDLRVQQLRTLSGPEGQEAVDEYEESIKKVGETPAYSPSDLADAIVNGKRLFRKAILRGDSEPSEELQRADERVKEMIARFEDEQRQRFEVSQSFEPRLRKLVQPPKAHKRR